MCTVLDNLPTGVERQTVAKVLDSCAIASERQLVQHTEFIDPWHREFLRPLVGGYFGIRWLEDGGYGEAERCRLIIYPDYYRPDDLETCVSLLEITLSESDLLLSHRDYLGALLGQGIKRGFIGDIIPFAGGGQAFVAAEGKDCLLGLNEVNKFRATIHEIPPYQVKVSQQPVRTVEATVASLRLDAVLSTGLGTGRKGAVELVRADKVRVNWRHISQPSFQVQQGDVITVRGKGRLEIAVAGGQTKKGRTRITLKKYD